jgi:CheY-like chemotaxis protein/HPt (histidine-containing phosphotransfer) domain-containing protein
VTKFSGLRVLVVDDNATSYMLLQETLSNWSASVTVLNSARLLGDKMHDVATRGKPFDVVLLDHSLPDATTEQLLRTIRLDPAIADTYVVLMSALDFNPSYEGNRAIAPDMCIAKPIGQQLLRGALQASRLPRKEFVPPPEPSQRQATVERDTLPVLGLHVLVVDDNAINREVAVAMLEELRCNVDVAEDGRVAVAKAAIQRFDVILMDCQMPGMDGYAATQAIRSDERARALTATTILALTANVLARDREKCVAAGMDAFLAKPFKSAQLVEALRPIAQARGRLAANPVRTEGTRMPAPRVHALLEDVPDSPPSTTVPTAVATAVPAAVPTTVATPVLQAVAAAAPAAAAKITSSSQALPAPHAAQVAISPASASASAPASAPSPTIPAPAVDEPLMTDTAVVRILEEVPAEPAPSRLPVLDLEQVEAIRGLGKPLVFERLCEMLFASAQDAFDRFDAALGRGDRAGIAAAAHAFKSPVSNLGGRRLADLLERCETAALEGSELAVVQRAATGLKPHYAALVAALEAETRRRTGTR